MNLGFLSSITGFFSGKWLLIGAVALASATSAWGAHSWTKASWESHHEAYKAQVIQSAMDGMQAQREQWIQRMEEREARLAEYQSRLREVRGDLEAARGETRIVYREIPVTDAGECQLTDDGVQLLQRAAAAANRAAGRDASAGAADSGDGERAALSGAAGGPDAT